MWGAIIGDIVGSHHEFKRPPTKTKEFTFFHPHCHVTDDSVCTAAVADILTHDRPAAATLQQWCRRHPDGRYGYGSMFEDWIFREPPEPYRSFGNGAGMRVSPAAFLNRGDLEAALAAADGVTEVTHNHPEGMKGARATTHAIWLALAGEPPEGIRSTIATVYGYDLSESVDAIRPDYVFTEACQTTIPQAITCALESSSFEDAVRNAVSLGGDADTLAAIAGAVAEALHGIPEELHERASPYLTDEQEIELALRTMYTTAGGEPSP